MFDVSNKLYERLGDEFILSKINHLDIPFSTKWKKLV